MIYIIAFSVVILTFCSHTQNWSDSETLPSLGTTILVESLENKNLTESMLGLVVRILIERILSSTTTS